MRFLHKVAQKLHFASFLVVVRSFTADSNLLQPTGCVNSTPHTSHFLVYSHLMTRTCVAQAQVWRAQGAFHEGRRQAYHSPDESLSQVSRCLSIMLEQGDLLPTSSDH